MIDYRTLIADEQGNASSARVGMWSTLVVLLLVVLLDLIGLEVASVIYTTLASVLGGFMLWAGGPRMAQYLGPMFAQAIQGISAAARAREPDLRRDDESGS